MSDPITREETFLAAAAGDSVTLPKPITRVEQYLKRIAERTGGGGSPDSPQNAAKWQVLHEAELTEEATIVITGFDTTLSEYVMSLIVPKVTAKINTGNAHFLGARAFIYSQSFGNTNYASHYTYHGTMISGGRMLLVVYENNANSVGFDNDYSTAFQAAKGSGLACDVTKGIALKGAFPVGTKVRLEGR